jgi:ubiquinone/menaquinone biosynthesis C-methylase UbiE
MVEGNGQTTGEIMNSDYSEANREMWNQTADVHARVKLEGLLESVKSPDFTTFDEVEKKIFDEIGLKDKAVIQLSCNNARELISCKKAGAGRCVGVDISDKFIEQGKRLAQAGNVEIELVRSSVYDLSHDFDNSFDLAYITIGALGWLQDMNAYFELVARLLKSGGQVFIYEMHPMLDMFDAETDLEIKHSYFKTEPYVVEEAPDYFDSSTVVVGTSYWFHHKLSDIIGGCLNNSLSLTHFAEYGHDISSVYKAFESLEKKPALSYSLVAQKKQ